MKMIRIQSLCFMLLLSGFLKIAGQSLQLYLIGMRFRPESCVLWGGMYLQIRSGLKNLLFPQVTEMKEAFSFI